MKQQQESLLTRTLVVAGFCAAAMIPLLAYGCGPEWARWDAAQAVMAYEQGNVHGAIYQLTEAVEKSPRDPSLKLSLAEKLIESNQPFQAERVCDEILKRFPDNDLALHQKAECQQAQGNFEKALETFKQHAKFRSWLMNDSSSLLNTRAYFRALANTELDNASDDIHAAVAMVNNRRMGQLGHSVSIGPRSLVASVIIARKIGMPKEAIDRLSPAIGRFRIYANEWANKTNEAIMQQSTLQFPPTTDDTQETRNLRGIAERFEKTLALLLTTRALCYQDIQKTDLSDQDRAEVRDLRLDADKIISKLPEDIECLRELHSTQALLDTRGFIISLLPDNQVKKATAANGMVRVSHSYVEGLRDLDQAVFAFEVFTKSLGTEVHNHVDNELDLKTLKHRAPRDKAVLLYHRMLLLEKMGEKAAAKRDETAIRKLGFEPGWHLF